MRVFSFIGLMWLIFKTFLSSLLCLTRTSLNPNLIFTKNPKISSTNFCKISSTVCFLTFFSSFHLDYAKFVLGFLNWGFSKKGLGTMIFGKLFSKFWLGCVPFDFIESVLFRHISMCSCIAHMCSVVLHAICLSKCSSGIFELVGLKWVPIRGFTLDWAW